VDEREHQRCLGDDTREQLISCLAGHGCKGEKRRGHSRGMYPAAPAIHSIRASRWTALAAQCGGGWTLLREIRMLFQPIDDGGAGFEATAESSNDAPDFASPQVGMYTSGNISVVWENDDLTYGKSFTGIRRRRGPFQRRQPGYEYDRSFGPLWPFGVDGSVSGWWEDDFKRQSDISLQQIDGPGSDFLLDTTEELVQHSGNSFGAQGRVERRQHRFAWARTIRRATTIFCSRTRSMERDVREHEYISTAEHIPGSAQVGVDTNGISGVAVAGQRSAGI